MHDQFNTHNGQYGFVVELADGTTVCEDTVTWDEIVGPIKSLSIAHLPTWRKNKHTFVTLKGFDKFFFSNAAVSLRAVQATVHTGKVFGGCNGDKAKVVKMALSPKPTLVDQRECAVADLGYQPYAFRDGV